MPATPWTRIAPLDEHSDYVVMATRFVAGGRRHVPRIVQATTGLWTDLTHTEGLIGFSMQVSLLRRTLSTLSVWRDDATIRAFVSSEVHTTTAARTRRWLSSSSFASWSAPGGDLPPSWSVANRHLATNSPAERPADLSAAEPRPRRLRRPR